MKVVSPGSVGVNGAQLARVSQYLRDHYVNAGRYPGTATLLARRGELCFYDVQGMADIERQTPLAQDSIFRIYSMTKPVSSVALMMLFERGLFSLHDPVSRYIPQFKNLRVHKTGVWPDFITVPCQREMNIADLLSHQAGLTYDFMRANNIDSAYRKLGVGRPAPGYTLDTMIEQLAELPLAYQPGSCWNYSVATDVVGYLVQVLADMPLPDFLHKTIFEPLDMRDTGFTIAPEKVQRLTSCYSFDAEQKMVLQDDGQNSDYAAREYYSGGGGLLSTMHDYYRFCQMLLAGGTLDGQRILGSRTLALMTRNHLPGGADLTGHAVGSFSETTYEGVGFGLGFARRIDAAAQGSPASEGVFSWGGMAGTAFWVDPVEQLVLIFMTQLIPSSTYPIRSTLENMIYAALDD
ncbi:MAG: serine hydrolase [Gammaproteobacteria bacterium]|nr:MAG: serine hydrolase [Gammaproteobacteria bacterium]